MSTSALVAIAAVAIAIIVYQGYVTIRVLKSSATTVTQKVLQAVLVWLLPAVGAAIVHAFLVSDNELPVKRDEEFIPNPGNDGAG